MTLYRMTIEVDVDDELLASHDGDMKPPPNDVAEWYGGDLVEAIDVGIAEIAHVAIEVEVS